MRFFTALMVLCPCLTLIDSKLANDRYVNPRIRSPVSAPSKDIYFEDNVPVDNDDATGETPDQDVDLFVDHIDSSRLIVKFASHGRRHNFDLKESRQRLDDIPIRLLGESLEVEQNLKAELKKIKVFEDTRAGAVVAMKQSSNTEEKIRMVMGAYSSSRHQFYITPDHVNKSRARISKRAIEDTVPQAISSDMKEKNRNKRDTSSMDGTSPVSGTIELVLLVDYSAYEKWLQKDIQVEDETDKLTNLIIYLAQMTEMISRHYSYMQNKDVQISVELAGVSIITSAAALSHLVEDEKLVQGTKAYIEIVALLDRLTDWLGTDEAMTILPSYDHIMLMTGHDMYNGETLATGVLGRGKFNGMCDKQKSGSVIEMVSSVTYNARAAAQLLGLSLGAKPDGKYDESAACTDSNYMMGPSVGDSQHLETKFIFSCCSQRSFFSNLKSGMSCLREANGERNYPSKVDDITKAHWPGQVYDADDQCYLSDGTKACEKWVYASVNTSICLSLYCTDSLGDYLCGTQHVGAADGTDCGNGNWCYRGKCIKKEEVLAQLNQQCNVRNCYGSEQKCVSGTNTVTPSMFNCYPSYKACDGILDCSDGSDEYGCTTLSRECPTGQTACNTGNRVGIKEDSVLIHCVPNEYLCDGEPDCQDGSDELCSGTATTQEPNEVTPSLCGIGNRITSPRGTLTSPNYPNNYPNKVLCIWYISAEIGHQIVLNFPRYFTFRGEEEDCDDSLSVYNLRTNKRLLNVCRTNGIALLTGTDQIKVTFQSDAEHSFPGWILDWAQVPTTVITTTTPEPTKPEPTTPEPTTNPGASTTTKLTTLPPMTSSSSTVKLGATSRTWTASSPILRLTNSTTAETRNQDAEGSKIVNGGVKSAQCYPLYLAILAITISHF